MTETPSEILASLLETEPVEVSALSQSASGGIEYPGDIPALQTRYNRLIGAGRSAEAVRVYALLHERIRRDDTLELVDWADLGDDTPPTTPPAVPPPAVPEPQPDPERPTRTLRFVSEER